MSSIVIGSDPNKVNFYSSFLDMLGIQNNFANTMEAGFKAVMTDRSLVNIFVLIENMEENTQFRRFSVNIDDFKQNVFLIYCNPEINKTIGPKGLGPIDHFELIAPIGDLMVEANVIGEYKPKKKDSEQSIFDYVKEQVLKGDAALPIKSDAALQILPMLEDEKMDLKRTTDMTKLDPGLHTGLLKMANSVYFGSRYGAITDMRSAFVRIGTLNVKSFLLNFINKSIAANKDLVFHEEISITVDESMYVAAICYVLASYFKVDSNVVFSIGLIHRIGYIFLLAILSTYLKKQDLGGHIPSGYKDLANSNQIVAGVALLKKWKFPPQFYMPIQDQNNPSGGKYGPEAKILFLARSLNYIFKGEARITLDELNKKLGMNINEAQLSTIKTSVDRHLATLKGIFG